MKYTVNYNIPLPDGIDPFDINTLHEVITKIDTYTKVSEDNKNTSVDVLEQTKALVQEVKDLCDMIVLELTNRR